MRYEAVQNDSSSLHCWDVADREKPSQTRARNLLKEDADTLVFFLNNKGADAGVYIDLRANAQLEGAPSVR